jgi:cytochrome c553
MKFKKQILALGLLGLALTACTKAIASPELVVSCNKCHGVDGNGNNPLFARLGAQQEEYLVNQLKAFRDGSRADRDAKTFMLAETKNLTDQDIADLSHYYATLTPPTSIAGDATLITQGEQIYKNGVGDTVMACVACHGENAEGSALNPRLARQFVGETIKQMMYYKSGDRKNDLMSTIAAGLTDDQIKAISAYLGSF